MQFDPSQSKAIDAAVTGRHPFVVITGGAGTGKTTIIEAIANSIPNCLLLAPTGKAAARIREKTGHEAMTIHRALLWDGNMIRRKKNFTETIIIDEASMVDAWLMAQVIRFKPRRLILVGDRAQLPPVGKGQPFHDIITLHPDHVHTLDTCHRAQGAIHIASDAVRKGQQPSRRMDSDGETWSMIDTGPAERSTATLLGWIRKGIYDPMQDIVLSCRYGSGDTVDGGIDSLNLAIRDAVNPSTADTDFRVNDRVIFTKNDGEADLWNGDIGTVVEMVFNKPVVLLDRDPVERRTISKTQMRDMSLAYALSVHKSQGSEFRRVFFLTLRSNYMMLSRSLIYTAITRARKGVCVFGEIPAFDLGIRNQNAKSTILQHLAQGVTA